MVSAALFGGVGLAGRRVVISLKHRGPCAERDWSSTESQMNDCAGEKGEEAGSPMMGCWGYVTVGALMQEGSGGGGARGGGSTAHGRENPGAAQQPSPGRALLVQTPPVPPKNTIH